jgi:hypothetical protein
MYRFSPPLWNLLFAANSAIMTIILFTQIKGQPHEEKSSRAAGYFILRDGFRAERRYA